MLCGFSINSWASSNCSAAPTNISAVSTTTLSPGGGLLQQVVPSTVSVIAGSTVTFTIQATPPANCTITNFQWDYNTSSGWLPFTNGTFPVGGTATISNATQTNVGATVPVWSATFTITGVPAAFYNGLQISATATDNDGLGDSSRSNTVTLSVASQGWIPDSPGDNVIYNSTGSPLGYNYPPAPLPSNSGTYERGTLLPSGQILAIGFDPSSPTHTETINVDVTPGIGDGLPDWWVASSVNLDATSVAPGNAGCNINNAQRSTVTLLPTGSVLIAGGLIGTGDTAYACLWTEGHYGNVANTAYEWTPGSLTAGLEDTIYETGSLNTPRDAATATLLGNGLVLIAGGASNGRVLNSAELFNPAAGPNGTFTPIPYPMTSPRYHHTATLLPNGLVLIVGGNDTTGANTLDTAELYNPAAPAGTNPFTPTSGTLWAQRAYHAATLLADGNVLITGGVDEAGVPVGSTAGSGSSAEIYDLADGTFYEVKAAMKNPRSQHTATLMENGKVLIAGGAITNGWLNTSEYFDPTAGGAVSNNDTLGTFAWTTPTLNTSRDRHDAWLAPSGMVVVAGGTTTADAIVPTAEKFGDTTAGAPLVPNASITFGTVATGNSVSTPITTAYVGQTLAAFCGPVNSNGTSKQNPYAGFDEVNFAWVVESGNATNIAYPNWPDTAEISFTVTGTGGNIVISCLATSIYGIPSIVDNVGNLPIFVPESQLSITGTPNLTVSLTSSPVETTGVLNGLGEGTPDPTNTANPYDYTTIAAGGSANFVATISPAQTTGAYTYTWQVKAGGTGPWTTIAGPGAASTYPITAALLSWNNNVYQVIATGTGASGAGGTFTSNPLILKVVGPPAVSVSVGPADMGPSGSCTSPLNPALAGGQNVTPCNENESAEAAYTASITPYPAGSDIEYQWCMGDLPPYPQIGGSEYLEYYIGLFTVNANLASNLCAPNVPAPGTGAGATNPGPFGAIYGFDIDAPPNYPDSLTYTPTPAAGVSPYFYVVAFDSILGVPGQPVASNQMTETVWAASPVVITNSTSCPVYLASISKANTAANCAAYGGNAQVDPTVDQNNPVTLTATFTGSAWPASNADPSYQYTWVYQNAIQGWKQFPASNCVTLNPCDQVQISAAQVGSDGLEIKVYVTSGPNTWPGYVAGNSVASANLVTSPQVNLQVIPATTVKVTETATDQANPSPVAVPTIVPVPIQGHQVVFTATISGPYDNAGVDAGPNCSAPNNTADCVDPNATYTWYQELVPGTPNPPTGTGSAPFDTPIQTGPTPSNNLTVPGTCDSAYVVSGNTLTINDLCLADGPPPNGTYYYAVAGYTENGINNVSTSTNAINLVVNWDQVTSIAAKDHTRFDAMSVNLPTIYLAAPYDVPGAFWVAGGQNSTGGVISNSAIYNSNSNYNGGTSATSPAVPANDSTTGSFVGVPGSFVAGPHLDGTATLFLSSGSGTPEIAIVGGSDGQDAQNGIEYFVPTWSVGPSAAYTGGSYVGPSTPSYSVPKAPLGGVYSGTGLPPITQQVAAHLPNQSILIAGGQNGDYDTFYNNAWILTPGATPGTGTDALALSDATLSVARAASKATTLNDGRVLITGGVDATGVDNAVDIYDSSKTDENTYVEYPAPGNTTYPLGIYNLSDSHLPSNNTSGDFIAQAICTNLNAPTPCMESPRLYHTQTLLLDGRVLITGGINQNGVVQGSMEIWDPTANPTLYGTAGGFYPVGATAASPTTSHPGTLLTPRMMASAVLLPSGNVLVFGGQDPYGNVLTSAEVVNPNWTWAANNTSASVQVNSLTEAREQATATLLGSGEVLATGGVSSSTDTGTLGEIFNALQLQDTPPAPEVDSDLVVPANLFAGQSGYATVTGAISPLDHLTDYSWFAEQTSPSASILALTMQEPTAPSTQALSPLSAEAGFTTASTSATPSTADTQVSVYVIDSLVTSQYGLTYLLSQDVTTWVPCAATYGGVPGDCYTAPPVCTPATSGGISITSTTGADPTLADIADSATGQWDGYFSVTGGTGTNTVTGVWSATPSSTDISTNGWVDGGGNAEPYPTVNGTGGDTGIIVDKLGIASIKVKVTNSCDSSSFTLTWTGTNTATY